MNISGWMRICVFIVILFLIVSANAQPFIKGLSPKVRHTLKFDEKTFQCGDGSKSIPFEQVNDNFCDCADGSDEPGTPACPQGHFWCSNKGYVGQSIFSSRVWDGICDCCDGSDEEGNVHSASAVKCANKCNALAEKEKASLYEELNRQKAGLKKKQEYVAQAKKELEEKEKKLASLTEELEILKAEKPAAEEARKAAEEAENAVREQLRKAQEEARKAQEEQEASNSKEEEREAGSQEVPPSPSHENPLVGDDHDPDHDPDSNPDDYHEVEDEYKEKTEDTRASEPEDNIENDETLKPLKEASQKERDRERELLDKIRNLEQQIDEIQKLADMDFGPQKEFYALYKQCFSTSSAEYTYELCLYDDVKQKPKRGGGDTSLGTWKNDDGEWASSAHKVMKYTGGLRCWGGPDRSATVSIQCDSENRLADPNEPNKCEYTLKFFTPAACDEQHVKALEFNLEFFGQDEAQEGHHNY